MRSIPGWITKKITFLGVVQPAGPSFSGGAVASAGRASRWDDATVRSPKLTPRRSPRTATRRCCSTGPRPPSRKTPASAKGRRRSTVHCECRLLPNPRGATQPVLHPRTEATAGAPGSATGRKLWQSLSAASLADRSTAVRQATAVDQRASLHHSTPRHDGVIRAPRAAAVLCGLRGLPVTP